MQQYLQKFLILHRKLSIPQLGSFYIDDEPARVDAESGLLFAPRPVIRFSEDDRPSSDKHFFQFLAEEMQVDELAAIREFHDFCYSFRNNIQVNQMASIQGIGRITRRGDDMLGFTPETNLLELLPPVPLPEGRDNAGAIPTPVSSRKTKERIQQEKTAAQANDTIEEEIVTEEEEEEIITTDRWWIYALVLAGLGVLALLNYYRLFASIL